MSRIMMVMLLFVAALACSNETQDTDPQNPDNNEEENTGGPTNATVWNGATITFTKADGADPGEEANQDRITDNVWITRGNSGGQIYNARSESAANKDASPAGTQWAIGELSELASLRFARFRETVGNPRDIVGTNLVMFIPDDNVVMSVRITSWSSNRNGGFAYERSTQ